MRVAIDPELPAVVTVGRTGIVRRLLLLASGALALALLSTPASALVGVGGSPGICGFEANLKAAIEDALDIHWSQCDEVTNPQLASIGELDLRDKGITRFAPDPDQFTGFSPFLIIDLRGNPGPDGAGLTVADIDPDSIPLSHDGDDVSYTLVLDGGGTFNGLTQDRYTTTEGQAVLVAVSWGDRPDAQALADARRIGAATELYFGHRIYSEQNDESQRDDAEYVRWLYARSGDGPGALYAGLIPVHDDDEIEGVSRPDKIEITHLVVADDRAEMGKLTPARADLLFGDSDAPLHDYVDGYLRRAGSRDEADLIVVDDDSPTTPVCARTILDHIEELLDESRCRDISRADLAGLGEFDLSDEEIRSLAAGDLDGFTGVRLLDLSGNELSTLPRGIFADIGTDRILGYPEELEQEVLIDLRGNHGPRTGDKFLAADLPAHVLGDLKEHQRIALDSSQFIRPGVEYGFDRSSYEVAEGGTLAFIVSFNNVNRPAIDFEVLASDTAEDNPFAEDASVDLPGLIEGRARPATYRLYAEGDRERNFSGTYAVAVDIPEETIDDGLDDTFTMRLSGLDGTGTTIAIAKVTIREDGGGTPPVVGPAPAPFGSWLIEDSQYQEDPSGENPNLAHNIPRLSATVDGQQLTADFMGHYNDTGGRTRWGLPTSEVLVIEENTLTQYYQRGVVDFHRRGDLGGIWVIERRLAWDYFGGGRDGSPDLGVEPGTSNSFPGTLLGPWGHKVSDYAVDGTVIGFAKFFEDLGGVESFGFPKTEARADNNLPGTLHIPTKTTGFVRQYFQAAVMEYHPGDPGDPIKLGLLGDDLRNRQFPNAAYANIPAFQAADEFVDGSFYDPPAVGTFKQSRDSSPATVG
ncbi:MAG: hypothetical protein OXP37_09465 [Chloroflexota bacterium]|nr:hypothetical protein [Chloroflexota bacterium]